MIFDHIAVSGGSLEAACAHVEDALGVKLAGGGAHPHFGTHNKLLGLGPFYLEAIAIDPEAAPLPYPRWFGLDDFSGAPRITNWICAAGDLAQAAADTGLDLGAPVPLQRDDLRWTMLVPHDGRLPFDGACPALIDWGDTPHPAGRLTDVGARLRRLTVIHPQADVLRTALTPVLDADVVRIETGDAPAFEAEITLPHGTRVLR